MADIGPIESTDDPAIAEQIEHELRASLSRVNRQTANYRKTFCLRGQQGQLVAGLSCSTAYGWLHIETLWVADRLQAHGLGRKLVETAEAFGLENGCHGAWLDTSNAGAYAFYRRLGYSAFGKLANGEGKFPAQHRRWFLQRAL